MTEQCLSDFVKELVTVLHFEQVTMPFENERPWHELFYELKHSEKTPGFLNAFALIGMGLILVLANYQISCMHYIGMRVFPPKIRYLMRFL